MKAPAIVALALSFLVPAPAAGAKPPRELAWALEALEVEAGDVGDAPAVTLLDEAQVEVLGAGGRRHYRRRTVIRVLRAEARDLSSYPVFYGQNSQLVDFKAWSIRPDGSIEPFAAKDAQDYSLSDAAGYSDARARVLPLRNVGVGTAVVVEFQRDEDPLFLQDRWFLQDNLPVALSRYRLKLPPGWTHEARLLNCPPLESRDDDGWVTWEARNVPALLREPENSALTDDAAQLMVTFLPKDGGPDRAFRTWANVASWYDSLSAGQAGTDDEMRRVVAALIEGADGPHERIRRIGKYVQDLRYVSISLGLSALQPHPSVEVFHNRYADCKDKTLLMISMLREAGIGAHPLLVNTRDDGKVFAEFPSMQFNHCIIAIPVVERAVENALVIHPGMGDVLVFDPTDGLTPVGDLPWRDQGTRGLFVHPEHGGLVDLPSTPPETNRAEREWEIVLERTGEATLKLQATYHGQYARLLRARYAGLHDAAQREEFGRWVAGGFAGFRLDSLTIGNLDDGDRPLEVSATAQISGFARVAGKMLIAEPFRLVRTMAPDTSVEDRSRSMLVPFRFEEIDRTRITLPSGYQVSEPPETVDGQGPIGRYRVEHRPGEGTWETDRRLVVDALEVDAGTYPEARSFLRDAAAAAGAVLVIERAPS